MKLAHILLIFLAHDAREGASAPVPSPVVATQHRRMGKPTPTSGSGCGNPCITVDTATTFQKFYGVGASMTGSSAANLMDTAVPSELKNDMLEALFHPDLGIGLSILRQPMGASDFTYTEYYTYEDVPGTFDIAKDEAEIIPAIQDALAVNSNIKIMSLPWSYPAWMKENNSLLGGSPRSDLDYAQVGGYFANYVQKYAAHGLDIWALSVQNEPGHGTSDYITMTMTPDQHTQAATSISSALTTSGYTNIKMIAYDHNWDQPSYPLDVLADADANNAIDAIAWHCYGGNVEAQQQVKEAHPSKEVFFTECTEFGSEPFYEGDFRWAMENLVFGTTQNHASTILEWNLVLDATHGPKLSGGCTNCLGLLNLNDAKTDFWKSPAYYAFGHVSKFVQYDATRVGTVVSGNKAPASLAFVNPDNTGVVILHNDSRRSTSVSVDMFGMICSNMEIGGMTVLSLVYDGTEVVKWETNYRNGNDIGTSFLQNKGVLASCVST